MQSVKLVPLKKSGATGIIQQLAKEFELPTQVDCLRHEVVLPDSFATEGRFVAYEVDKSLDALIITGKFPKPIELLLQGEFPPPIAFYTVGKGTLKVSSKRTSFEVKPLQGSIHGGNISTAETISIPGNEDFLAMIIYLHRDQFFNNLDCEQVNLPSELHEVVAGLADVDSDFLFQEIFHLPAVNAVTDILLQENTGMLNSTFATAKIHETLFLHLNEYKKSEANNNSRFYRREEQLKSIQDAESILTSSLQEPPTIPELARMVGINQQSLKQGFRQVYGDSINKYLTDKRLEQAGILMRSGEMPINEVASIIGYNSAGYFSKRFKKKYGVSPKEFRQGKL
ncbi:helix-turn-helix domain-containing protein [Neolewinella persica]|uniref:helix-turn-helix domain-containing protein n=1 Tax=Neolewinella persica TaxID=70998 RepID=UPI0003793588|nr:AraC family transcriptional regulator [Neolewinella persica]